jgi:hypothetical protein
MFLPLIDPAWVRVREPWALQDGDAGVPTKLFME